MNKEKNKRHKTLQMLLSNLRNKFIDETLCYVNFSLFQLSQAKEGKYIWKKDI